MNILYMSGKTAGLIAQSVRKSTKDIGFKLEAKAEEFTNKLERMSEHQEKAYSFKNIDYLKDVADSLQKSISASSAEYCNIVSDILFKIEMSYQTLYDLDENDWDRVA